MCVLKILYIRKRFYVYTITITAVIVCSRNLQPGNNRQIQYNPATGDLLPGSTATYSCGPDHASADSPMDITCQDDGTWEPPPTFTCQYYNYKYYFSLSTKVIVCMCPNLPSRLGHRLYKFAAPRKRLFVVVILTKLMTK